MTASSFVWAKAIILDPKNRPIVGSIPVRVNVKQLASSAAVSLPSGGCCRKIAIALTTGRFAGVATLLAAAAVDLARLAARVEEDGGKPITAENRVPQAPYRIHFPGEQFFSSVFGIQLFAARYASTVCFHFPCAFRMYSTASRAAPSPPEWDVVQCASALTSERAFFTAMARPHLRMAGRSITSSPTKAASAAEIPSFSRICANTAALS